MDANWFVRFGIAEKWAEVDYAVCLAGAAHFVCDVREGIVPSLGESAADCVQNYVTVGVGLHGGTGWNCDAAECELAGGGKAVRVFTDE